MKKVVLVLMALMTVWRLPAQTNMPVKLALISGTDETAAVVDLLTAKFSGDGQVQLLERNEIDKVYREQGLSAANTDYLKLGRVLGADGLVLFDVVRTGTTTNLTARLIAVKPGVILMDDDYPWPIQDLTSWAGFFNDHLDPLLPKLKLSAGQAIPISVVNFRSAISRPGAAETERQLKLLAIQRLSHEQQFFVLERQKMQLLGEEKELSADDSAFWDGSYLLEGVLDQNGYAEDTLTIDARLTPKGGQPLLFRVSGSRTNEVEIINQLALKVSELLKVRPTAETWEAAAEAEHFYEEAQWAMRWGVFSEAEAAADSAWALGKRDVDCAIVRVGAYNAELSTRVARYQWSGVVFSGHADLNAEVEWILQDLKGKHQEPTEVMIRTGNGFRYVVADHPRDLGNIGRAIQVLELYAEFCRDSPDGRPKILSGTTRWGGWPDSDWYQLGLEVVTTASKILQNFCFSPEPNTKVADQLAELRARVREVARFIAESPTIDDGYFTGHRVISPDEVTSTLEEQPNIFRCEVNWGCFWQEHPADTIALYQQLMASPLFGRIDGDFWKRGLMQPRLIAWNEEDKKNLPVIWGNFIGELNNSTNRAWPLEARALIRADSTNDESANVAEPEQQELKQCYAAELAAANGRMQFEAEKEFLQAKKPIDSNDRENEFYRLFVLGFHKYSAAQSREIWPLLVAYRLNLIAQIKESSASQKNWTAISLLGEVHLFEKDLDDPQDKFEEQKQFLQAKPPVESIDDFNEFVQMFVFRLSKYSPAQALEIKPLLAAYESSLEAQTNRNGVANGELTMVRQVEKNVDNILNPPAPASGNAQPIQSQTPAPQPLIAVKSSPHFPLTPATPPTNILQAENCFKIPVDRLPAANIRHLKVVGSHWYEGKLLMDLQYYGEAPPGSGFFGSINLRSAAIFYPATGTWQMVPYPDSRNHKRALGFDTHNLELFHGQLYLSLGSVLQRYNFPTGQWQDLPIVGTGDPRLFLVNGHLYAASSEDIFEITDDGTHTRLLASIRRRPPVTTLDSLANLGSPILFSGRDQSLCAFIGGGTYAAYGGIFDTGHGIFSWDGSDWQRKLTMETSRPPEVFEDGVIFRFAGKTHDDDVAKLWLWDKNETNAELGLVDHKWSNFGGDPPMMNRQRRSELKPLWKSPGTNQLATAAAAYYKSNLYIFADHAMITNIGGQWTAQAKDGYHATLYCLSRDQAEPVAIPMAFDLAHGPPPLQSLGEKLGEVQWEARPTWMHFSEDTLYLGESDVPAVWAVPLANVQAALAAVKAGAAAQKAALAIVPKKFLEKYDLNHNGLLDPEEKEAALEDPAFIEAQLDLIDTNHNERLDLGELFYFDANQDKILEPREAVGLQIAQKLLAQKALLAFDQNGDGVLNPGEFRSFNEAGGGALNYFPEWDKNRDGKIDAAELEACMNGALLRQLMFHNHLMLPGHGRSFDQPPSLKDEIEAYWRNPADPPWWSPKRNGHVTNRGPSGIAH